MNALPQFKTGAKQFELFLSGHMYVLANDPPVDDVIQLALLLPDSSLVHKQAVDMTTATIGRKKNWFNWRYTVHITGLFLALCSLYSNKLSDPEKYSLKLKLHHDGVQKCRFSEDESKVLSCASNEVKVRYKTPSFYISIIFM